MLEAIAKRMFGSANERFLKGLGKDVKAINALEPSMEALSDEDLAARTPWLRQRLADGEDLESLLGEPGGAGGLGPYLFRGLFTAGEPLQTVFGGHQFSLLFQRYP